MCSNQSLYIAIKSVMLVLSLLNLVIASQTILNDKTSTYINCMVMFSIKSEH